MRKIPTLFRRDPDDMAHVLPEVNPGCEWVLAGEGAATRKYDGTCVLIRRDGLAVHAFARREVKPGKTAPAGFVEVEHDATTGKTVGWEPVEQSGYRRQIVEAVTAQPAIVPGTYELCGPTVQGNPEAFERNVLVRHGTAERVEAVDQVIRAGGDVVQVHANLGGILAALGYEGVVWHHPDGRMAKLKARDFA